MNLGLDNLTKLQNIFLAIVLFSLAKKCLLPFL